MESKEVAPSRRVRWLLGLSGMLVPEDCARTRLYSAYSLYSLSAIASCFVGCIAFIVINGTPLEKLQSMGISITILNGLLKHTSALKYQGPLKRLLHHFDRLWFELAQKSTDKVIMDEVEKRCSKVYRWCFNLCLGIILTNAIVPLLLYFLAGADKQVFQISLPYHSKLHFVPQHLIIFTLTVSPFVTNSTYNYLYYALSQQLAGFMTVLQRHLLEDAITDQTVQLHQEIIRLTNGLNQQFGHLLYFETNTIAIQCSCTAYIVYKINIINGERGSISVNIVSTLFCYFIPYLICYCGSVIKTQSEALMRDSYNGLWYQGDIKARKRLSFLMLGASKPLLLKYKNLATFSMELFLGILNGTYTFLNAIVWLEKAGTKTDHKEMFTN